VPVFGAFIVWIPVAIFLALDGSWGRALIPTAWGTLVVGIIDNLLYPMLVGNRLKLHSIPSFVSVVGGLLVFGASGLIHGPLAVTITLALLQTWRNRISTNPGDSSELSELPARFWRVCSSTSLIDAWSSLKCLPNLLCPRVNIWPLAVVARAAAKGLEQQPAPGGPVI